MDDEQDPLEEVLGLPHYIDKPNLPGLIPPIEVDLEEEILKNLNDAISKAKEAMDAMADIAKASQHPQAYDILNKLLKTYADLSVVPLDLKIKQQKLDQADRDSETGNQTVNNLFVGSTSELMKLISEAKKGNV